MGIKEALAAKRKPMEFDIGIGEPIYLRKMSGHDRAKYLDVVESLENQNSGIASVTISAHILIISLIDKAGVNLYSVEDLDEVMGFDIDRIDSIVNEAAKINGLSGESVEDAQKK